MKGHGILGIMCMNPLCMNPWIPALNPPLCMNPWNREKSNRAKPILTHIPLSLRGKGNQSLKEAPNRWTVIWKWIYLTMVWEYLPEAKPPHASLLKHGGIAPSNVSWHVLQYVALVDSGEKSSSTSMSLEKTNGWSPWPPMKSIVWGAPLYPRHTENKKLPSRKISLPIAMQPFCGHCPGDALLPSSPSLAGVVLWYGWRGKVFFWNKECLHTLFLSNNLRIIPCALT